MRDLLPNLSIPYFLQFPKWTLLVNRRMGFAMLTAFLLSLLAGYFILLNPRRSPELLPLVEGANETLPLFAPRSLAPEPAEVIDRIVKGRAAELATQQTPNPTSPPPGLLTANAEELPGFVKARYSINRPSYGRVKIKVSPQTEVLVDGRRVSPAQAQSLRLAVGVHTIVLKPAHQEPTTRKVLVRPRRSLTVRL